VLFFNCDGYRITYYGEKDKRLEKEVLGYLFWCIVKSSATKK